jgi:Tfp pilus assembly protein PilX
MKRQKGASALTLVVIILAVIGLVALGLNQTGWLSEKSSGNQVMAARNQEAVASAMEVAQQLLNTYEKRSQYLDFKTGFCLPSTVAADGTDTTFTPDKTLAGTMDVSASVCTDSACSARYTASQTFMLKGNLWPDGGVALGYAVIAAGDLTAAGGSSVTGSVGIGGNVISLAGSLVDAKQVASQLAYLQGASVFGRVFDGTVDEIRDVAYQNAKIPEMTGGLYWQDGDLSLTGKTYGSPTAPLIVVVNQGDLTMSSGTTLYGYVYVIPRSGGTVHVGGATIVGGLAAAGNLSMESGLKVVRDGPTLNLLKYSAGSFVKLPDSWRDF